jgi:hypothetical protein
MSESPNQNVPTLAAESASQTAKTREYLTVGGGIGGRN